MNKTTKTIILGSLITFIVLITSILALYFLYPENKKGNNDTPVIKENTPNETTNNDNLNEKVTLYMFHGSTCPACQNALKTIKDNKLYNTPNLEIKTFEVWSHEDNSLLMQKVAEKLNVEARYIPFFVINNYSTTGYDEKTLKSEIEKAQTKEYTDIVNLVLKENPNLNPKSEVIN